VVVVELKLGSRWKSAVCNAEIVIVRPPKLSAVLECGGSPVVEMGAAKPEGLAVAPAHDKGVMTGKRYFDPALGIEVLGSKAGVGSLSIEGRPLSVKEPKALPSSD
jgi:hypothetical protein